ncbi:MAG TPA: DsbA family protein [Candidatus Limnocylindria bacterium]|nr:DsbA family protein [Candidatus Limnocylindria bacterium]
MDIQVWADFQCPYCMIGKRKLQRALDALGVKADVRIRSYILYPEDRGPQKETYAEHTVRISGADIHRLLAKYDRMEKEARDLELAMHLRLARHADVWDAHRLFQYAVREGRGREFFDLGQKAVFTEGLPISDHGVLLRVAEEAGLDVRAAMRVLRSGDFLDQVKEDFETGLNMGIDYIPYYLLDSRYLFSGDLTQEEYDRGLRRALGMEEAHPEREPAE